MPPEAGVAAEELEPAGAPSVVADSRALEAVNAPPVEAVPDAVVTEEDDGLAALRKGER